jgi:peptidoglycan/LPS O-acetylase OafA/YrhL
MLAKIKSLFNPSIKKGEAVKIPAVESLRGIAALIVVLFHYSSATHIQSVYDTRIEQTFSFGYLGVQIFFVISGFVIPLSQYKSNYKIGDFFKFIFRRIIRINLPYYSSIILLVGLMIIPFIVFHKSIEGVDYSRYKIDSLLYHLLLVINFTDYPWYNAVYWTLAVEYQYYIVIGLFFPVLIWTLRFKGAVFIFLLALLGIHYIQMDTVLFFKYVSLFVMGIIGFLYYQKLIDLIYFIILTLMITVISYFQLPLIEVCFAVSALLLMIFVKFQSKLLLFIGKTSYSLYITHTFTAYVAEMVIKRLLPIPTSFFGKCFMFGLYVSIGVAFAYIFYRLVELPVIELSKKVRLTKSIKEPLSQA